MKTVESKINIRIDKKTKNQAKKTFEELGLDLSSGVKLFLHTVINTGSIPFEIKTKNGYTLAQEKRMISETEGAIQNYKKGKEKGFKTAKELHKTL